MYEKKNNTLTLEDEMLEKCKTCQKVAGCRDCPILRAFNKHIKKIDDDDDDIELENERQQHALTADAESGIYN